MTIQCRRSRVKGIEFEGTLLVVPGLPFNFGATYLNATYRDYRNAPSGPVQTAPPYDAPPLLLSVDASGKGLPLAPRVTAALAVQYTVNTKIGNWTFATAYHHNSGFSWEPDNLFRQQFYDLFSRQISYRPNERFSISIWSKNLTDKINAAVATTRAGPAGYPFIAAPTRTYGLPAGFESSSNLERDASARGGGRCILPPFPKGEG
ncbi:TonB-dependent receptor [Sphingobium sp. AN558]|uniref:TonB-dependent receptor domain-containing protein n=1 Tax=Sphingobium sp. AN558 TaxID=3133442 RepID=UPI0030BB249C